MNFKNMTKDIIEQIDQGKRLGYDRKLIAKHAQEMRRFRKEVLQITQFCDDVIGQCDQVEHELNAMISLVQGLSGPSQSRPN